MTLPTTGRYLYFESVKISIREGSVYDIRVLLSDVDNKHKYYFVNKVPISLLRYMKKAGQSYLINKINNTSDTESITDNQYEEYVIRLSDVLRYLNNPGDNFVPDDKDLTFPIENDMASATTKTLRLYKIIEDTSLQNILELRTYTDFLGLFDEDSPNGLVQVEGKADFFLAPFQVTPLMPLTFFKKTTPYVNYARIDDEIKNVTIIPTDTDPTLFKIKRSLEIIEKAYLDMGIVTDIVGFSFTKEFPFSINLYIPVRYKVAAIEFEDGSDVNFKTIGYGVGARIEVKRFNNFGFTNSSEWTKFNHLNRIDNLDMHDNFWIFRNESEIFYYPNKTKKQSIFLRLRSHLNTTDTEGSFFQLQFGYRFALGLGKK